nr:hypothetical protein [Algoriphagus locisalis]
MLVYITEVWELSNDARTITVQTKVNLEPLAEERSWTTVFEKDN